MAIDDEDTVKLLKDFEAAKATLVSRQESFVDAIKRQQKKLGIRRRYQKAVLDMEKMVVGSRKPGNREGLAYSYAYKACFELLKNHQAFLNDIQSQLLEKLEKRENELKNRTESVKPHKKETRRAWKKSPYENDDFALRIYSLPFSAKSLDLVRWMGAEYRQAMQPIDSKWDQTSADFEQCSKKLPASYGEYLVGNPAFVTEARGSSPEKKHDLVLAIYPRFRDLIKLQIVKPPSQG